MGSGTSKPRDSQGQRGAQQEQQGNEEESPIGGDTEGLAKLAAEKVERARQGSLTTTTQTSMAACDVMISYSHADKEMMNKLKDSLEENGFTVWVDKTGLKAGVDFLSKIGQAIIDAKLFITLLSEKTIASKYCQDELALAYVSSKAIFPVGLQPAEQLFPLMEMGMKLQLARYSWTLLQNEAEYDTNIQSLVKAMREEVESQDKENETEVKKERKSRERPRMDRLTSIAMSDTSGGNTQAQDDAYQLSFWERRFGDKDAIPWDSFKDAFLKEYSAMIDAVFSKSDQDWLMAVLFRELNISDEGELLKQNYTDFCTLDTEQRPLWEAVQDQATESYAIREVFNMDSSVRVEAIENLAKFRSVAVIEALQDLLVDRDSNVRAVAAISLAKIGAKDRAVIRNLMKCVADKDRLVRESGCLALGHLKVTEAVPKLVHLWRNDVISHVREAAAVALEQIGGEEANQAMHMTKVLQDEIRMLTMED